MSVNLGYKKMNEIREMQQQVPSTTDGKPVKILVVGPSWMGDIVLSHTLYQLLIEQFRDEAGKTCIIDVLAPGWSAPLFNRMPEIRRVIDMPLGHGKLGLGLRRQLGQSLRKERYDRAIVLPNSFKSAIVPFSAKIPERIGWRGEMRYALLNDVRVLNESALPLLIQRFAALAFPADASLPDDLPVPKLKVRPDHAASAANKYNLKQAHPVIVLCPEEVKPEDSPHDKEKRATRCQPEHFGEIAVQGLINGFQVWLLGTSKQRGFAKSVANYIKSKGLELKPKVKSDHLGLAEKQPGFVNLAGATSLNEVMDLLSLADCVVTDDPGLKQVSAALDRPTVAVELVPVNKNAVKKSAEPISRDDDFNIVNPAPPCRRSAVCIETLDIDEISRQALQLAAQHRVLNGRIAYQDGIGMVVAQ